MFRHPFVALGLRAPLVLTLDIFRACFKITDIASLNVVPYFAIVEVQQWTGGSYHDCFDFALMNFVLYDKKGKIREFENLYFAPSIQTIENVAAPYVARIPHKVMSNVDTCCRNAV